MERDEILLRKVSASLYEALFERYELNEKIRRLKNLHSRLSESLSKPDLFFASRMSLAEIMERHSRCVSTKSDA
jgi:hypothetical protein